MDDNLINVFDETDKDKYADLSNNRVLNNRE